MKKRIIIYLSIICIFIVLVVIQRDKIEKKRNKEVVNIMALWKAEGKPVKVHTAVKEYVLREQKLTLVKDKDDLFYAYVTSDVKKKIYPMQPIYMVNDGHQQYGEVEGIDENIDMDTGLYKIFGRMKEEISNKERLITYIQNSSKDKVFAIPNDIIDIEDGRYYLWKVVDGKAERVEVNVCERCGDKAIIAEGIEEGDILIIQGQNIIRQSDLVKTIQNKDN